MTRYYGAIGYGEQTEGADGVWTDTVVERSYYGDVIRNSRRLETGEKVNDDLTVGNSISIVSDAYADQNFFKMRYVMWAGTRWEVSDVEVQPPRLILRLGGVYNGRTS